MLQATLKVTLYKMSTVAPNARLTVKVEKKTSDSETTSLSLAELKL